MSRPTEIYRSGFVTDEWMDRRTNRQTDGGTGRINNIPAKSSVLTEDSGYESINYKSAISGPLMGL